MRSGSSPRIRWTDCARRCTVISGRTTQRPQPADPIGLDAARTPAVARRTAHAGDVGAGLAHEREIVRRQLAGKRDEEACFMSAGDPCGERAGRDERAQTGSALVCRVEQHAGRAERRPFEELRETRRAIRVGVRNRDDAGVAASGLRPAHCGRNEPGDPLTW